MPNDPCLITTHDAWLPKERGKDPLHHTNGPSTERSLLNVTAEKQHDSQLQVIYIINQHLKYNPAENHKDPQTQTMISFSHNGYHFCSNIQVETGYV